MEQSGYLKFGFILGIVMLIVGIILMFFISPLQLFCLCIHPPVEGIITGILGVSLIVIGIVLIISCYRKKET